MKILKVGLLLLVFAGCATQGTAVVDSDLDGVPDSGDRCPNTPRGGMIDEHGCMIDIDVAEVIDVEAYIATQATTILDAIADSMEASLSAGDWHFSFTGRDSANVLQNATDILTMAGREPTLDSVLKAALEVEDLLRDLDEYVEATVVSEPPGCVVSYYRAYHGPGIVDPVVTTNKTIRIHPARYAFKCQEHVLVVDCASPCEVRFPEQ